MTIKLYYQNSYIKEWNTKIKKILKKDKKIFVELFETAFYPEGGGQPSDKGRINNVKVLDVQLIDGAILHEIEYPLEEEVKDVKCELDWNRRMDHMQQHTGQHLLSAVIHDKFQAQTVSFHLGKEYTTIDVDIEEFTSNDLIVLESVCNEFIINNKEIKTYFVSEENLADIPLRKIPTVKGNFRIVEIEDIDYSACAGTHVTKTGELGIIKLTKTEKHKGKTRLFFLCGKRALTDYQQSHHILSKLSEHFRTNKFQLIEKVEKLKQEKKELLKVMEELKQENTEYQVNEILNNQNSALIHHIFEEKSFKDIQLIAKSIITENDVIILFESRIEQKLLLRHNGTFPFSCGLMFKDQLALYNGKGGGNETQAQASFQTYDDLTQFVSAIQKNVSELL